MDKKLPVLKIGMSYNDLKKIDETSPKPKRASAAIPPAQKTAKEHIQSLDMHDRMWGYNAKDKWIHEHKGGGASTDFRNHDYFTDRAGEEDDDHPHFTGKDQVVEHVKRHLGADKDHYHVRSYGQEKGYFTVELHPRSKTEIKEARLRDKLGPRKGQGVFHQQHGKGIVQHYNSDTNVANVMFDHGNFKTTANVKAHEFKGYEKLKPREPKAKIKKSVRELASDARQALKKIKR